jgi:hypothetical protein
MSQSATQYERVERRLQDHYFSVDIETDGPIPGEYSMLSFGIVEAGTHDGNRYSPPDRIDEFYVEIAPLAGARFEPEALEVNGLDRSALVHAGDAPESAMRRSADWILSRAGGRRPVMVGSPAVFDWMFLHWYYVKFVGRSPFGYSSAFDLKTMIAVKTQVPIAQASVKHLPTWLMGSTPRTHNALDDARNQAQAFSNVIDWRGVQEHGVGSGLNERF